MLPSSYLQEKQSWDRKFLVSNSHGPSAAALSAKLFERGLERISLQVSANRRQRLELYRVSSQFTSARPGPREIKDFTDVGLIVSHSGRIIRSGEMSSRIASSKPWSQFIVQLKSSKSRAVERICSKVCAVSLGSAWCG